MGALFQGTCYPSASDARRDHAAKSSQVVLSGTTVYSTEVTFIGSDTFTLCARVDGGTCTSRVVQAADSIYPSCSYDGGVELALDWGYVALALFVVIYGGKQIIRLFEAHHNPD